MPRALRMSKGIFELEWVAHNANGIIASCAAAGMSAAGIFTMVAIGARAHRLSAYFSAFAVGMLSTAVLLHLMPEALADSVNAWQWAAVGFIAMAIAGMGIQLIFMRDPDGDTLAFGYASILALGIHSLMDGAVYAASFHEEAFTGFLSVAGLLLHEFPEGIIAYLLLRETGLSSILSGIAAFATAGLTTIAGAFGGYFAIEFLTAPSPSLLYGLASGALVYALLRHLIPHAAKTPRRRGYAVASLGVIFATLMVIIEQLSHGHHHH